MKDGNIVVFHDNNLKRLCGINKRISNCTYVELLKCKLLNTSDKIPLLENVLKLVNGRVPILIEVKYYKKYGILEEKLMKILDKYNGKYAIQSFYFKTILWFKKNRNDVVLGLLSMGFKSSLLNSICKTYIFNLLLNPDFISYNINGISNYIIGLKNKKLLLGFTVKNKKDYSYSKKYFDNLICENMNIYL